MPSTARPSPTATRLTYVVSLAFGGVHRGLAGPFPSESEAEAWVDDLLDGEAGWSWELEPVVAPDTLPSAASRRVAKERQQGRRHLRVVRDGEAG
jgi:hypothetical protein